MKRSTVSALACVGCVVLACAVGCGPDYGKDVLAWKELPALPDPVGFAGPFAGASNGALIVAGGANFPTGRPWDGATKVWHDRVFVLAHPRGSWKSPPQKLPRPLAYGVSASANNVVVCCGGGDAGRHYADAFLLRWDGLNITTEPLPPMPAPAAVFCGAIVGQTLSKAPKERAWQVLAPWPGRARMLAVAGAQDGHFFLISGVDLVAGPAGKPRRRYLRDVYRYTPDFGWRRMADLPHAVAGAPTPAVGWRDKGLLVLGGDVGRHSARVS